MEPIDWNKPIELMNGEPQVVSTRPILVGKSRPILVGKYIEAGNGTLGFSTDNYGCIGGVQVVRNRKEPVKKTVYIYMDPNSQIFICPLSNALEYFYTKILVWRDAKGKTRVEVCDD